MSEHHRSKEWASISARMREVYKQQLPLPCGVGGCQMGGVVWPGQPFDVGHIIDVAKGGDDSPMNLVCQHKHCNRSQGGTSGNKLRNNRIKQQKSIDNRTREW